MKNNPRHRILMMFIGGALLFAAALGCNKLGRKKQVDIANTRERVETSEKSEAGLNQKTNLYIKDCMNRYSDRVMGSYQRYASWLRDLESGPTGKETLVYGLYDISGDGQDCLTSINKAKEMSPRLPEAEAAADTYGAALKEVIGQIKAIYPYYNHEDYKDDGFQRGKDAHRPLLAAFRGFEKAYKDFTAEVDKLEDEVAEKRLEQLRDDPSRKYEYEVVHTGVKAKQIMRHVKERDYSQLQANELQPLIEDFEKAVEELKAAGAKRTLSSLYVSACDSFLKAAKSLMRRVRDKEPFSDFEKRQLGTSGGWMVEGSRDRLVYEYNQMISRRSMGM
jgi:hypothetical protein